MEIHIAQSILFDSKLHSDIQNLAEEQDRDFAGQVRHMLRQQLEQEKPKPREYQTFVIPNLIKKSLKQ